MLHFDYHSYELSFYLPILNLYLHGPEASFIIFSIYVSNEEFKAFTFKVVTDWKKFCSNLFSIFLIVKQLFYVFLS